MAVRKIKEDVIALISIDWHRRLFDELIPLPDGTTYNAYLIKGKEKTALIDSSDPRTKSIFLDDIKKSGIEKIDYVISNHAEQDHSGSIPDVLALFPSAKVVASEKCKDMLVNHLLIPEEKFITVKDGDTLPLGGKTLEFISAPWVHWPETILTYLKEDKILFPCDLFGSHLATSDFYAVDETRVYEAAKRYYAEIMMPFRTLIKKHVEKLEGYEIEIIAPSHGPAHNKPDFIISAYKEWTSDMPKNEVIIPFVSAHGSVGKMVEFFIDELLKRNITVKPFNLPVTDTGELAVSLVDAATIVIGTPTILAGSHPAAAYAAILANALRPKAKFASIIGSYGWGGRMPEQITSLIPNLKVEIIDPVISKGYPKEEDFKKLQSLAQKILKKHKSLNLV